MFFRCLGGDLRRNLLNFIKFSIFQQKSRNSSNFSTFYWSPAQKYLFSLETVARLWKVRISNEIHITFIESHVKSRNFMEFHENQHISAPMQNTYLVACLFRHSGSTFLKKNEENCRKSLLNYILRPKRKINIPAGEVETFSTSLPEKLIQHQNEENCSKMSF